MIKSIDTAEWKHIKVRDIKLGRRCKKVKKNCAPGAFVLFWACLVCMLHPVGQVQEGVHHHVYLLPWGTQIPPPLLP